jgi:hypothetical protein
MAALIVGGAMAANTADLQSSPLVSFAIVGSTNPTGPFTSTVNAGSSQQVYYEVEVEMEPVGSVNSTLTITSLVPGTDGVTSLSYSISDPAVSTFNSDNTLVSPWGAAGTVGATPGTASSSGVTGAVANLVTGVVEGVGSTNTPAYSIVETGSFLTGSAGSTVTGSYGTSTGGFRFNDAASKISILSGDPHGYVGFSSLTVAIPEPASLGLLCVGSLFMLSRRRRL